MILLLGTAVVLFLLLTPVMLQTIPPRYLARLPKPIQELGAPKQAAAILPTVAVTADLSLLLLPSATPTAALPATNTAVPAPKKSPPPQNPPKPCRPLSRRHRPPPPCRPFRRRSGWQASLINSRNGTTAAPLPCP
ncbi:MAG: hypothetical protein M5U34_41525 [Chloroflexi bacterium]|nr:hypothetical protein [Chloroflexota bacterium]